MIESYKFRLYPTKEQEVLLAKHFGTVRFVYNWALDFDIKKYATCQKHLGWMSICTSDEYHQLKKDSSVDVKFADTNIRYIGTADILKLTTGNDVLINNLSYDNPKIGDVVVDPKNGRSAVMDIYGHWQLVST